MYLLKSVVFWVITRRRVVIIYRRFGTTYLLHPHGSSVREPRGQEWAFKKFLCYLCSEQRCFDSALKTFGPNIRWTLPGLGLSLFSLAADGILIDQAGIYFNLVLHKKLSFLCYFHLLFGLLVSYHIVKRVITLRMLQPGKSGLTVPGFLTATNRWM
jgi:hypothetical protein